MLGILFTGSCFPKVKCHFLTDSSLPLNSILVCSPDSEARPISTIEVNNSNKLLYLSIDLQVMTLFDGGSAQ